MRYPYWLVFLLALDRLGAAWIFNRPDITISSLCWIARFQNNLTAQAALTQLKMYWWQPPLLRAIAAALELIHPGHCAHARVSDVKTSNAASLLLDPYREIQ